MLVFGGPGAPVAKKAAVKKAAAKKAEAVPRRHYIQLLLEFFTSTSIFSRPSSTTFKTGQLFI